MKRMLSSVIALVIVVLFWSIPFALADTIFEEDFEAGLGNWEIDNGIWEIGEPTVGPGSAYSGTSCAGTVLDGNYPPVADSRLISPEVDILTISAGEEVVLRFQQFFTYASYDKGYVQIQSYADGAWSDWTTLKTMSQLTPVWHHAWVDLSAYAGMRVRIGFYHEDNSESFHKEDTGWYIDDVEIVTQAIPLFTGLYDFESGWGGWYSDSGIWEVGEPTVGPGSAYSGTSCAGTVLDGNYPPVADSRLISPEVDILTISAGEEVVLRFQQFFTYASYDKGYVQIQSYADGAWSDWTTLKTMSQLTPVWHHAWVDLSAYAGMRVRIGFFHEDNSESFHQENTGWYIDDVEIVTQAIPLLTGLFDFESGWDGWYSDSGIWEVGEPTVGPGAAYSGTSCAGTVLDGNYPPVADSRLISPEVYIPTISAGEEVVLRFQQFFTYASYDKGYVQIQSYADGAWSDWTTLKTMSQLTPVWHHAWVDLSAYAGMRVRIGFFHEDNSESFHQENTGWYIDDVEIVTQAIPLFTGLYDFESGWGGWYSDSGIWEVGEPTVGPGSAYSGTSCAGTVLDGNYPAVADSRLISPEVDLPGAGASELLLLRFWSWSSYASRDHGYLQISVWENDSWGEWETLIDVAGVSNQWSRLFADLTEYSGKQVRLGFFHEDNSESFHQENTGWYIDDVQLSHFIPKNLSLSQDYNNTFVNDGDRHYYVIEVPPGGHLRFNLDDQNNAGINEVYLRHGALPTAGDYDYRFSTLSNADQGIVVPSAIPGPWYILIISNYVGSDGAYTIQTAFSTGILMQDIFPDRVGNIRPPTITIDGAGFESSAEASLIQGSTIIPANGITFVSDTRLIAEFDMAGLTPGSYQLRVQLGGSSDQLPFEVLDGGTAKLEANLIVPSRVGYHRIATVWVEYKNTGDVAMLAPLFVVTAKQNDRQAAIMKLTGTMPPRGFWARSMPEGFSNAVQLLATGNAPGILQPGESLKVPIQFAGWQLPWDFSYPPINFQLGVLDADNTTQVDWESLKDQMQPESISDGAWDAVWQNFVSQVGSTWGDYVAMLSGNADYLSRLGLRVTDISDLLAFEFAQADGLNIVHSLTASVDSYVEAPGLNMALGRVFPQAISRRHMIGAFGYGWYHNWQTILTVAADGTVTVMEPDGAKRIYQPDSRPGGRYFAMEGDYATLTNIGSGVFTLQEADGVMRAFRPDGILDYLEDTNGNRITANYSDGRLTGLSHTSGQSIQISYNADGRIDTVTDPVGRQTSYTYDTGEEHLLSAAYFDGSTVNYRYHPGEDSLSMHALAEIEFPGDRHQYFTYDERGRLQSISRDEGAEAVNFSYNTAGTVAVSDAFGNTSQFYLDHNGLLRRTTDPQGNVISMDYDPNFNLVEVVDPAGKAYQYDYDDKGNVIYTTDPLGNSSRFGFNAPFNRLTQLMDAKGNVTRYGYDTNGNLSSITYDDDSVESWEQNTEGNPYSWTNRRGNTISYSYDVAGRVTAKIYPDESRVDYIYDARGNLVTAIDPHGTTSLQYDSNDRLERITYPGDRFLHYTYNTAGQRASMVDQLGHRLDYHYDAAGRLEAISDETSTEIVRYHYDTAGRMERKDLGNGVYTEYAYDTSGQLVSLSNRKPDGSILSQFEYTYDKRGRRSSMTTTYGNGDARIAGLWGYDYDDLGQLVGWTAPDGRRVDYEYDSLGNRMTVTENGEVTNYTTNNLNQYTQVGDELFEYDADGNLIKEMTLDGSTTYIFNDENRLIDVFSHYENWNYTYDAFGNRTQVIDDGTVYDVLIDLVGFGNVVSEYEHSDGHLKTNYRHGFGLISMAFDSVDPLYSTFDALGNVMEITNNIGFNQNGYSYMPFGELLIQNGNLINSFQYIGEFGVMAQDSKLFFMRERFYNKETGSFISTDPLGSISSILNPYQYVHNNPVSRSDPTGLFDEVDVTYVRLKGRGEINPPHLITVPVRFQTAGGQFETFSRLDFFRIYTGFKGNDLLNDIANRHEVQHYIDWINDPVIMEGRFEYEVTVRDIEAWKRVNVLPHELDRLLKALENDWKLLKNGISKPVASVDPNEKIGPTGYGVQGLISKDQNFFYRVNFENESNATAPAQIVTVTDQLDDDLDWGTFVLTEIGFGDERVAIPEDTQHFETSIPMSFNGVAFEVQVEAGVHLATGEAYAYFYTIEPLTGLPPTVDVGFLPPEDGTGRGQGYFTYVIKPKFDLPAGTEIRNVANITFDFQETIATNQVDPHDPSQGTDPNKECLNTIAPDYADLSITSSSGGVVVTPGEGTHRYDWGANVDLVAVPDEGKKFISWSGDVDTLFDVSDPTTTIMMYDNFTITANFAMADITIPLSKGFNLMALPVDIDTQPDLRDWMPVIGNSINIEKVMAYDSQTGQFMILLPDDPNHPSFMLQEGQAIIVYARENTDVVLSNTTCPAWNLMPGLNYVGAACIPENLTAFSLLSAIGDENVVNSIERFNPETGQFETAGYQDSQPAGIDFTLKNGEGYLIFMKSDVVGFRP